MKSNTILAAVACLILPQVSEAATFTATFSDFDLLGSGAFYNISPLSFSMELTTEGDPYGSATRNLIDIVSAPLTFPTIETESGSETLDFLGRVFSTSGGDVVGSGVVFGNIVTGSSGIFENIMFVEFAIGDVDTIHAMAVGETATFGLDVMFETWELDSSYALVDNLDFADGTASVSVTITEASPLAPVPLPATLPLLFAGLAGIGMATRRRRVNASPES